MGDDGVKQQVKFFFFGILQKKFIKGKGFKVIKKFVINVFQFVLDKIFDVFVFEKFLNERIKVEGCVGNFGEIIKIFQIGDGKIEIIVYNEFFGCYFKYL